MKQSKTSARSAKKSKRDFFTEKLASSVASMFSDMCSTQLCVESTKDYESLLLKDGYRQITKEELLNNLTGLITGLRSWEAHVSQVYDEEDELSVESLLTYYENQSNGFGDENDEVLYQSIVNYKNGRKLVEEAKKGWDITIRNKVAKELYSDVYDAANGKQSSSTSAFGSQLYWWISELDYVSFAADDQDDKTSIGYQFLTLPTLVRSKSMRRKRKRVG